MWDKLFHNVSWGGLQMKIVKVNKSNLNYATQAAQLFYWKNGSGKEINETFFMNEDNIMYVAVVNERVVGMVYGYSLERFDKPKKQLFLYSIDVLEAYRRQNIGKELIHAFLAHMNLTDYQSAFVLTNRDNEAAVNLYKSTGANLVIADEGEHIMFSWSV